MNVLSGDEWMRSFRVIRRGSSTTNTRLWREGAETEYEVQMAAYCLAVMKRSRVNGLLPSCGFSRALKIVKREFYRAETAERLIAGAPREISAIAVFRDLAYGGRSYCDSVACGFRERCWVK